MSKLFYLYLQNGFSLQELPEGEQRDAGCVQRQGGQQSELKKNSGRRQVRWPRPVTPELPGWTRDDGAFEHS